MISSSSLTAAVSRSAAAAVCGLRGPSVLRRVAVGGHAVWGSSPPPARAFGGDHKSAQAERKSTAQDEADIAEADARVAIAKASASKATAEAAAADARVAIAMASASKATAEAAAAVANNWRRTWLFNWATGVVAIGVCGLTLDLLWHENEAVIKWNMARTLRACKLPPTVPEEQVPAVRLETRQSALQETFLVTMLLGPTGCGKSTVLKDLARKFISARTPTFLIGFRKPKGLETAKGLSKEAEALELMDATAKRVFDQVGFPTRRALISPLLDSSAKGVKVEAAVSSTGGVAVKTEGTATLVPAGSRLIKCFTYLFDVVETVAIERQVAGKKDLAGAVVLAFDELEDLTKDDRLRLAGGQLVLDHLASLLVNASVDNRFAQIYVAGSSAKLAFVLASPATDFRVAFVYLADPTREAMLEALTGRGYTPEDARRMVDFCGTRLRLFEGPLTWKTPPTASDFITSSTLTAEGSFRKIFRRASAEDKIKLAATLDGVEASYSSKQPFVEDDDTVPPSLAAVDLAPALFINHGAVLTFQSQLHRNVWARERKRFQLHATA